MLLFFFCLGFCLFGFLFVWVFVCLGLFLFFLFWFLFVALFFWKGKETNSKIKFLTEKLKSLGFREKIERSSQIKTEREGNGKRSFPSFAEKKKETGFFLKK